MTEAIILIFYLIVLMFSVIIHEISHGYVAERLGDPTARLAGRLTLNPLRHLDFFGSFLLPILFYLVSGGAFVFGWAKPVPYNPYNLQNPKTAAGKIAVAGPISNLVIAIIFGLILRGTGNLAASSLGLFFSLIIYTNVLLAVFNLIPLPPLDGSKVLFALLPAGETWYRIANFLEQAGVMLLLIFIFFGFQLIVPIINFLFFIISGHNWK
jgi:Zn-dependent protease